MNPQMQKADSTWVVEPAFVDRGTERGKALQQSLLLPPAGIFRSLGVTPLKQGAGIQAPKHRRRACLRDSATALAAATHTRRGAEGNRDRARLPGVRGEIEVMQREGHGGDR